MPAASIEEAIYTRSQAHAGLSALISTRAYHYERPQAPTYPHVVFWRVGAAREIAAGADPGICRSRFQFDVWAATTASMRSVGEQVRLAFERWRGTTGTVVVQDSFCEGDVDIGADGREVEQREYHRAIDFEIIYQEATS